jgi:preprotein translocase subunit SecG
MYLLITILIIVVCVLLGGVVLIQNPKGGGLSASFGGVGQQLLGARRSTDVVEKATWVLAFSLIFLCLATAFCVPKKTATQKEALPKSEVEQYQTTNHFNGNVGNTQQQQTTGGPPPPGAGTGNQK